MSCPSCLLPDELIQQCLSTTKKCDPNHDDDKAAANNTNTNDPGALLQLVLSVLANSAAQDENEEEWLQSLQSLLFKDIIRWDGNDQRHGGRKESLTQTMYQHILGNPNDSSAILATNLQNYLKAISLPSVTISTSSSSTAASEKWYIGLQLVAILLRHSEMTAFEVHSVAVQSVFLDAQNHQKNIHGLYFTLIELLCCWSLDKCHDQIVEWKFQQQQQQVKQLLPPKKIRWKRIKSILFETIQLYQRQVFPPVARSHEDDDDSVESDGADNRMERYPCPSLGVPLWVDHIAPVCQRVWNQLKSAPAAVDLCFPDSVFLQAIVVNVASQWMVVGLRLPSSLSATATTISSSKPDDDNDKDGPRDDDENDNYLDDYDDYVSRLQESLQDIAGLSSTLDEIWCHPWRVASHRQQQRLRHPCVYSSRDTLQQDRLDWWTLERYTTRNDNQRDDDNENDDDGDDESSDEHDEYDHIDTTWNALGVACLAQTAWSDIVHPRACVYNAAYTWRLLFPHVATLMDPDQQPDTANNMSASVHCIMMGLSFLQELLPIIPARSLALSTSFSLSANLTAAATAAANTQPPPIKTGSNKRARADRIHPPDHPVATFQLLLNVIVSVSSSSSLSASSPLPSAMQLFELCKVLLSKYVPQHQIEIVFDHLLPTCPHPGLKPKIIDMVRPLLMALGGSQETTAATKTIVTTRMKEALEEILAGLANYFVHDRGHLVGRLRNVEELIDQTELFVSACAMLLLLGRTLMLETKTNGNDDEDNHKRRISDHPADMELRVQSSSSRDGHAIITLRDFHMTLRHQLRLWNTNNDGVGGPEINDPTAQPPDQFFRLHLLENSIQQLLDLKLD